MCTAVPAPAVLKWAPNAATSFGEHRAILQARAVASLWRSRPTAQAHPRLNHCSTTPPGSQVMQFFRITRQHSSDLAKRGIGSCQQASAAISAFGGIHLTGLAQVSGPPWPPWWRGAPYSERAPELRQRGQQRRHTCIVVRLNEYPPLHLSVTGSATDRAAWHLTWGFTRWQVLGSNQRRLSRRFYRRTSFTTVQAADLGVHDFGTLVPLRRSV